MRKHFRLQSLTAPGRFLSLLLTFSLLLLPLCPVRAENGGGNVLSVESPAAAVRPGKAVTVVFNAPADGMADIDVVSADGRVISVIAEDYSAWAGRNSLYWNGTWNGARAEEGSWLLRVTMAGETATAPVTVGPAAPYVTGAAVDGEGTLTLYASMAGTVRLSSLIPMGDGTASRTLMAEEPVPAGTSTLTVALPEADENGSLPTLKLSLTDGEGVTSDEVTVTLSAEDEEDGENTPSVPAVDNGIPLTPLDDETEEEQVLIDGEEDESAGSFGAVTDQRAFTPSYASPYDAQQGETGYWVTPMDITDEAAVWEMLMQPITVINTGKKNAEKTQVTLRAEPDEKAKGTGVVTQVTQGVRILREEGDWTLVEAYSASFHDTNVEAWNMLVQGWVRTKYLTTTKPSTKYGIVIDKLTQRLYIFKEGKLYDTLLVSTGLSNQRQPYNETRSGEFLLTSAVGEFSSDRLRCSMAIRFDCGDLLHEVPHVKNKDGSKNYSTTEYKLGTKCSHGCIRVQRKKTPLGTNMKWLWDNRVKNTKLVIWEDWQGRVMPYPDDSTTLYYNPDKGTSYHTAETCYAAKGKTFTAFTYGQLEDEGFAALTACDYCAAPMRKAEIDERNARYLPGYDHDPVLTAARSGYMKDMGITDGYYAFEGAIPAGQ